MKKTLLYLFVSAVVFTSCNDDRIDEEAEFQPMDEFYLEHKPEEQEFVITSDSGDAPIIGMHGTELWGGRHILEYPNGDTVPFPYSLKLIELYSYKDMILYQMPSLSGTTLLETGGEVKIRACHNGNELVVKQGEKYPLVLSTTPTKAGMKVFQGDHPSDVYGDWDLATDGSLVVDTGKYGLGLAKLGWQNCAQTGASTGEAVITFKVEGKGGEFIDLFLITEDYKGLLMGNNLVIRNIPIGEEVTVIAMAKDQNDDFRLHQQTLTITGDLEIELKMDVISEGGLLSQLGSL